MYNLKDLNVLIYAPVNSYSGYGSRSRDFCIQFISKYKNLCNSITISEGGFGNTQNDFLLNHKDLYKLILDRLKYSQNLTEFNPDIFIQIDAPSMFSKIGKIASYLMTAGILTNMYPYLWMLKTNKTDGVIVSSEHSKFVIETTKYTKNDTKLIYLFDNNIPLKVLFLGYNQYIFNNLYDENSRVVKSIDLILLDFLFLFVGNFIQTGPDEDRKDLINLLITMKNLFLNKQNKPALLIKTNMLNYSTIDYYKTINTLKLFINDSGFNIYLLHNDLNEYLMNDLYNHPKVKCMINFTHGLGFGRPLLLFASIGKPIITSNWSGHLDFLNKNHVLLRGLIKNVKYNNQYFIPSSQWFYVNYDLAKIEILLMYKHYDKYLLKSKKHKLHIYNLFNILKMGEKIKNIFDELFLIKGIK